MNPKHTPGPWATRLPPESKYGDCVVHAPRLYIGVDTDNSVADARLIAAAPEMLDVLRTTLGNIMSVGPAGHLDDVPMEFREWAAVVSRVIAKAEGKS
ncbi:MAG: hypothetical protein WAU48_12445 [Gammaproteobacteria bacterium]